MDEEIRKHDREIDRISEDLKEEDRISSDDSFAPMTVKHQQLYYLKSIDEKLSWLILLVGLPLAVYFFYSLGAWVMEKWF